MDFEGVLQEPEELFDLGALEPSPAKGLGLDVGVCRIDGGDLCAAIEAEEEQGDLPVVLFERCPASQGEVLPLHLFCALQAHKALPCGLSDGHFHTGGDDLVARPWHADGYEGHRGTQPVAALQQLGAVEAAVRAEVQASALAVRRARHEAAHEPVQFLQHLEGHLGGLAVLAHYPDIEGVERVAHAYPDERCAVAVHRCTVLAAVVLGVHPLVGRKFLRAGHLPAQPLLEHAVVEDRRHLRPRPRRPAPVQQADQRMLEPRPHRCPNCRPYPIDTERPICLEPLAAAYAAALQQLVQRVQPVHLPIGEQQQCFFNFSASGALIWPSSRVHR